jgi:hypothetical protein
VTTFNPTATSGSSQLFVFNDNGKLLRQVTIAGSSPATLGLAFHPTTHTLLVIDFGPGTSGQSIRTRGRRPSASP